MKDVNEFYADSFVGINSIGKNVPNIEIGLKASNKNKLLAFSVDNLSKVHYDQEITTLEGICLSGLQVDIIESLEKYKLQCIQSGINTTNVAKNIQAREPIGSKYTQLSGGSYTEAMEITNRSTSEFNINNFCMNDNYQQVNKSNYWHLSSDLQQISTQHRFCRSENSDINLSLNRVKVSENKDLTIAMKKESYSGETIEYSDTKYHIQAGREGEEGEVYILAGRLIEHLSDQDLRLFSRKLLEIICHKSIKICANKDIKFLAPEIYFSFLSGGGFLSFGGGGLGLNSMIPGVGNLNFRQGLNFKAPTITFNSGRYKRKQVGISSCGSTEGLFIEDIPTTVNEIPKYTKAPNVAIKKPAANSVLGKIYTPPVGATSNISDLTNYRNINPAELNKKTATSLISNQPAKDV